MKKIVVLLILFALVAGGILASKTYPCSDGFSACVDVGGPGSLDACQAGFEACMCSLYGYGC